MHKILQWLWTSQASHLLRALLVIVHMQVAGYVTEYDVNDFKFVTVKGSGHMVRYMYLTITSSVCYHLYQSQVPQYQPKFAYYMFERFLHNKPM